LGITLPSIRHHKTPRTIFYGRFREKYPWLPTKVIKGAYN